MQPPPHFTASPFNNLPAVLMAGIVITSAACAAAEHRPLFDGLGAYLDSLTIEHGVPGLSLTAFNDADVLFEHVSGTKNHDTQEPIDAETTFEAASISKPVFAYIVLTLVRDGILDLDEPLPPHPVLAHDERYALLTPRLLLAHLGGLPNWRSRLRFEAERYEDLFAPGDTLQFVGEPGIEHRYSGEGYVLLQQIVEHAAGKDLNTLAQEIVFAPLGMTRSGFRYDEHIRANTSMGHTRDQTPDKWEISMSLASSTLHTTASDLAAFGIHLASGVAAGEYYAAMAQPAVTVEETGGVTQSWGLGLGVVADERGRYMYHGGNNVIFIADFIYGFEENLGYALLTNGANGRAVVEAVERRIFGRDIVR